jgi:hypothetical protein
LVVGNTHAGPCIVVSESSREEALRMLRPGCTATADSADRTVEAPVEAGFLVSSEIDEYERARYLQSHITSRETEQHLIIFPTEQCNIRSILDH